MSDNWTGISFDLAKRHPLYGIRGWLLVFAIGLALGTLKELALLNGEAYRVGLTLSQLLDFNSPVVSWIKFALLIQGATVAITYYLMFTWSSQFRPVTSGLLVVGWPLVAVVGAVNSTPEIVNAIGISFFSWIISCGVWVTYLNRSRRVRVTFENQVLHSEGIATMMPAPPRKPTTTDSTPTRSPMPVAAELPTHTSSAPPSRHEATSMAGPSPISHPATEEDFWAAALHEVDGPTRKAGLWAKTFALANGNEAEAKAAYLRERVLQIEQESKKAAEHRERQLADAADRERQAFRKILGGNRAELFDSIQFIKLNTYKTPIKVLINVVRLLGGQIERGSTGIFSSAWIVALKGNSLTLRDDVELSNWFLKTVLPMAESSLPEHSDASPLGCCPSCDAVIPLNVASCFGCEASFVIGSAWKPIPREIDRADSEA